MKKLVLVSVFLLPLFSQASSVGQMVKAQLWYEGLERQPQIEDFSKCIQQVVKGYDSFLNKRCPYIMGLHASPELNDNQFHFHVEFYPPLRHNDKPKVLAGSESMAGVFIMDVLPEDSAKVLRKFMS